MKLFLTGLETILFGSVFLNQGPMNPAFNAPMKDINAAVFLVMATATVLSYGMFTLMVCRFVDEFQKTPHH